jgi:ABC-type polysaccharide/polyol phosphate export permease
MLVYTFVFAIIMRVKVPNFPVFLLSGLLPWSLIAVSVATSAFALLSNESLIRKVSVPQMVYPLSLVGGKLVDTSLSLVPLALLSTALGKPPTVSWLFVVPGIVLTTAFAVGLALLFSSLTVFFRDIRHLLDILLQVWFYLTPVLYPWSYLDQVQHQWVRLLLSLNPASYVVRCFQQAIYEGRWPDTSTVAAATVASFSILAFGLFYFRRIEHRHIHYF